MRRKVCSFAVTIEALPVSLFIAVFALPGVVQSADSQTRSDLSVSVEPMNAPSTDRLDIRFSGTDMIMELGGDGRADGKPTVMTIVCPDETSYTVVTQSSVWGDVVRSGDLLYTIECLYTRSPRKRTFMLKEYNLKTSTVRTLRKPNRGGFERVHLHNGTLYLLTRRYDTDAGPGSFQGSLLYFRVIPLAAVDHETTYCVKAAQLGERSYVLKHRAFAGSLYCRVRRPRGIYRLDFGSKDFVKLLDVGPLVDFCIVPDGPYLAYLRRTAGNLPRYVLGLLALDGTMDKPIEVEFDPGEIRFFCRDAYGGLQYDPIDRSFIMRGNIPPFEPHDRDRFFYRIRVSGFLN